jgi:hypothetical protein
MELNSSLSASVQCTQPWGNSYVNVILVVLKLQCGSMFDTVTLTRPKFMFFSYYIFRPEQKDIPQVPNRWGKSNWLLKAYLK